MSASAHLEAQISAHMGKHMFVVFDLDGTLALTEHRAHFLNRPGRDKDWRGYVPVAFGGNRQSGPIEIATALNAHGGPHGRLDFETETFIVAPQTAGALRSGGFDASEDGSGRQPALIAFDCKAGGETGFSIGEKPGAPRGEGHGGGHAAVAQSSGVRRLMPTECEALQGVPRNFTRIPWRSQPEELCPDGPRYRALGNAYPRPVLAWIGRRIARAASPAASTAAE